VGLRSSCRHRSGPWPGAARWWQAAWLAIAVACGAAAGPATAATVRIATAFDPQTMDPHALALLYHSRVVYQVYESLVARDEQFRIEPGSS